MFSFAARGPGDSDDDDCDDLAEGLAMAAAVGVETMEVLKILRDGNGVPLSHCVDYVAGKLSTVKKREEELAGDVRQYSRECGRLEREIGELEEEGGGRLRGGRSQRHEGAGGAGGGRRRRRERRRRRGKGGRRRSPREGRSSGERSMDRWTGFEAIARFYGGGGHPVKERTIGRGVRLVLRREK